MHQPLRARAIRILVFTLCFAATLFLTNCATQPRPEAHDPPGFWSGLLHGFVIFFSFIASFFSDSRIYAFPNSGGWYDFGYLLGASMFLGGGGASCWKHLRFAMGRYLYGLVRVLFGEPPSIRSEDLVKNLFIAHRPEGCAARPASLLASLIRFSAPARCR